MNGGWYVLRQGIFEYLDAGTDLVDEPFSRLAAEDKIAAVPYDGFWLSLDTLKELNLLIELEASGHAPWAVWRSTAGELDVPPAPLPASPGVNPPRSPVAPG
jgi:glucose-1-phosphate cytidylyltransferase